MTNYQHTAVCGVNIFYREAGSKTSPTIVLPYKFPNSSHMFRDLIPQLSDSFHVIAPDYPGFGYGDAPDVGKFEYTFDNLAARIEELLFGILRLKNSAFTCRITALASAFALPLSAQMRLKKLWCKTETPNMENIGPAFDRMKPFWANRDVETEKPVRKLLMNQTTISQYTHGVKDIAAPIPLTYQR